MNELCANINSQHLHNLHILFELYICISILLLAVLMETMLFSCEIEHRN